MTYSSLVAVASSVSTDDGDGGLRSISWLDVCGSSSSVGGVTTIGYGSSGNWGSISISVWSSIDGSGDGW